MKFNGKDVQVDIFIVSVEEIDIDLLKKFFTCEEIETEQGEVDESGNLELCTVIFNTKISNEKFNEFLFELSKKNIYFELSIESDECYIYEHYKRELTNDYIIKNSVDEKCNANNGMDHLKNILFHGNEEKILIKDLYNKG